MAYGMRAARRDQAPDLRERQAPVNRTFAESVSAMIQITPHMRILAAVMPVDFRKGIDGRCAVCRQHLMSDPFSGALLVFLNKSRQALRILVYDGQGFCLCHKCLSRGRFLWNFQKDERARILADRQLQTLLWNTDPLKISYAEDFRCIEKNFCKSSKKCWPQVNISIIGSATLQGKERPVADLWPPFQRIGTWLDSRSGQHHT